MTSPGSGSVMTPSGKVCVSGCLLMVVFRVEAEVNSRDRNFAAEIPGQNFCGWYFAVNIQRLQFSPREFRTVRVLFGAIRSVLPQGVYPSRWRVRGREY